MPNYKYTAKNLEGKTITGTARANDEADLHQRLRQNNLYVISCKCTDKVKGSKRMKANVLAEYCQQLGTMLGAGITLVRALSIMSNEEGITPQKKQIYESIMVELRQGTPLSVAMENCGNTFPALLVNIIRSAEGSGGIDQTCMRMAKHYEKEHKLNQKVQSAMVYPIIVLVLAVAVTVFLVTFILPQFDEMLSAIGDLPWNTVLLMNISASITTYWYVYIVGTILFVFSCRQLIKLPSVQFAVDHQKVLIPKIGLLVSTIYTARLARTLSSLYSSGMPIISVLQVAGSTIGNRYIASQFPAAVDKVRSGELLSRSLDDIQGLRKKLSASVSIGEEAGNLDSMLDSVADSMEYDSEIAIQKLLTMMEPAMLVVLAIVVGFIIMSVLLPVFDSYSAYGNDTM